MIEFELNWEDKSTIEDKFIIERQNGVVWIQVGEVEKDVETFVDYSAKLNTEYTYRVVAEAFGKRSDPSNEFTLKASGIQCTINPTADLTFSVAKTGTDPIWITPPDEHSSGLTVDVLNGQAGTLILIVDDKANVSTIDLGSVSGAAGEIDLTGFSSLTSFTAKNGYIQLRLDAATIQRANYTLDLENSTVEEARFITLIDRIILANGGDTTDDSTDYTGSAGASFANRVLNVGTLTLDLTINTNKILYQKVKALEAVGWTISTIKTYCEKIIKLDTKLSHYVVTWLERTQEIVYLNNVAGKSLYLDLYDTEAHAADVESTDGRLNLNSGVAGVNDWLDQELWPEGTIYYLRAYSSDPTSTGNKADLYYKAYPDENRPCGAVVDVTGLESRFAYSTRKTLVKGYTDSFYSVNASNQLSTWLDQNNENDLNEDPSPGIMVIGNEMLFDLENHLSTAGLYETGYDFLGNNVSLFTRFNVTKKISDSVNYGMSVCGISRLGSNDNNISVRINYDMIQFTVYNSQTGAVDIIYQQALVLNQWYTTGIAIDLINLEVKYYLNGELVSDGTLYSSGQHRVLSAGGNNDSSKYNFKLTEQVLYAKTVNDFEAPSIHNYLNS